MHVCVYSYIRHGHPLGVFHERQQQYNHQHRNFVCSTYLGFVFDISYIRGVGLWRSVHLSAFSTHTHLAFDTKFPFLILCVVFWNE